MARENNKACSKVGPIAHIEALASILSTTPSELVDLSDSIPSLWKPGKVLKKKDGTPDEGACRASAMDGASHPRAALGDQRKPLPAAIQKQFSNRFVFNEDMGWAPEGWDVVPLDSIIELIGGGTPKTSVEEYWGGEIPWFSVVDAPSTSDIFVINTEKQISSAGLENSSAKLLPVGTTIISARGTVGKCAIVGAPMAMNQSCYGIRGIGGYRDYYVYYTILLRVADLQQRGHGSVFNTITRDTFRSIKTVACPHELSDFFDESVEEFLAKIVLNLRQTEGLAALRDTLLPKLLSGQLRIPEAEKKLAEAL
jgi:type I restriction enzyme, S subunit